jgi:hypothetical protein
MVVGVWELWGWTLLNILFCAPCLHVDNMLELIYTYIYIFSAHIVLFLLIRWIQVLVGFGRHATPVTRWLYICLYIDKTQSCLPV